MQPFYWTFNGTGWVMQHRHRRGVEWDLAGNHNVVLLAVGGLALLTSLVVVSAWTSGARLARRRPRGYAMERLMKVSLTLMSGINKLIVIYFLEMCWCN
jgi:hypothetical protein